MEIDVAGKIQLFKERVFWRTPNFVINFTESFKRVLKITGP